MYCFIRRLLESEGNKKLNKYPNFSIEYNKQTKKWSFVRKQPLWWLNAPDLPLVALFCSRGYRPRFWGVNLCSFSHIVTYTCVNRSCAFLAAGNPSVSYSLQTIATVFISKNYFGTYSKSSKVLKFFLKHFVVVIVRPSLPASTAGFEFMFNFINTYNVCSLGYFMLNKNKPNYIPLPANSVQPGEPSNKCYAEQLYFSSLVQLTRRRGEQKQIHSFFSSILVCISDKTISWGWTVRIHTRAIKFNRWAKQQNSKSSIQIMFPISTAEQFNFWSYQAWQCWINRATVFQNVFGDCNFTGKSIWKLNQDHF